MADLFAARRETILKRAEPLAARMRPASLEEVSGQEHLLGEGKLLRRMLAADAITSLLLHGPPGTGKTTIAELIASYTKRDFVRENAASVGVKRIREVCEQAAHRLESGGPRTILFLDEIHRFTRSQQDVLLGDVERGLVTLIGATTENPLFACNAALVSRSTLFRLEPVPVESVVEALRRAISDTERGYGVMRVDADVGALMVWATKCDGDVRRALTALEVAVLSQQAAGQDGTEVPIRIDREVAEDSIQQKAVAYDHTGDGHYDAASALIKSVRGNDPDAAVYWTALMLEAGEDPRFIARRMAILASEDIGNADPRAIVIAQSAWDLVERIGMPEARITLGQLVTYLALAPKSNAAYTAIDSAMKDVSEGRTVPVPLHLRDPNSSPVSTEDAEGRGVRMRDRDGERYEYSHNTRDGVTGQDYLGVEKSYYEPTTSGAERVLAERLAEVRKLRERARSSRNG
ncbi:MAG: replication-associated recombination protein A [Planctomycetota bacterium]